MSEPPGAARSPRELVAGRHKALVFSQFTDFLKLLAQRLDGYGISYQCLLGSTPETERGKRVVGFQRGEGNLCVNGSKIFKKDFYQPCSATLESLTLSLLQNTTVAHSRPSGSPA